jgi:hypothetical protein
VGEFSGFSHIAQFLDYFSQIADALLAPQVFRQITMIQGLVATLKATHCLGSDLVIEADEPFCRVVRPVRAVFTHLVPRTFYMLQQLIGLP